LRAEKENVTLLCRKSRPNQSRLRELIRRYKRNGTIKPTLYYFIITVIIELYGLKSRCRWLRGQVNGNNVKFRRCGAMNHPKVHSRWN